MEWYEVAKKVWGVLILVLLGVLFWARPWHHPSKVVKKQGPEKVHVQVMRWSTYDQWVDALGTVTAPQLVVVHVQLDGQPLITLNVHEGEQVHQGQILARIDPRPYRIQVEQAQAQMLRDQQLLSNAQRDLVRYEQLLRQHSVSDQTMRTQQATVAADQATVAADQAALDNARLQLSYTDIHAPMDGVVGLRQVDPGNLVHVTDPNGLMTITRMNPMDVLFSIPQDDWLLLQSSETHPIVQVWNRDESVQITEGRVLSHDNQIDASTGTLKIRAEFANPHQLLLPGAFVVVRIRLRHVLNVPVVSEQALLQREGKTLLDVVRAGRVRQITVHVKARNGQQAWLDPADLPEGTFYVREGTDRLEVNMPVVPLVDAQP